MGLMQKAVATYDNFASLAGLPIKNHATLTPISHILQNVQLEIAVHSDGTFAVASAADEKTVIPATEKSANRTGDNTEAHPLSDQLRYVAPFGGGKYEAYIKGLSDWVSSPFRHPKLEAVLKYAKGGSIVEDLANAGLIELEPNGEPAEKYRKLMIRWRVLGFGEPTACWEDDELFRLFHEYYQSTFGGESTELCMISGEMEVPAKFNPKGIVASAYGAKLISANDSSGFTYRGRFDKPREAATIGYQATQKAHCALQWVSADQGVIIGGRTFVCWNPKGLRTPNPISPFGKFKDDQAAATPADYKSLLFKTVEGIKNELPDNEDVVIAAFDAATTGRLSLTYYSELRALDFRKRLEKWYETCVWPFGKFGYQSPSIKQIATCAFGVQRGEFIDLDDRVLKETVQRLLPCVVNAAPIPADIVRALSQRVSMPLEAYSGSNRLKLGYTACAVIRKYHNDIFQKEEYSMELDPKKQDRSYQYGRLLAVYEKIERDTYAADEAREPNAIRMQTVFSERPLYAARVLKERLVPYYEKLNRSNPKARVFYDKLIGEIISEIPEENVEHSLGDTYILGYYLQKNALYTSNKGKNDTNDMEDENDG